MTDSPQVSSSFTRIVFHSDEGELIASRDYFVNHSPIMRQIIRKHLKLIIIYIVFMIGVGIPGFFLKPYPDLDWYYHLAPWIVGMALVWLLVTPAVTPWFVRFQIRDNLRARDKLHSPSVGYGVYEASIVGGLFRVQGPQGLVETEIKNYDPPCDLASHVIFVLRGEAALTIAKHKITEGDLPSFVECFRKNQDHTI